MSKFRRLAAFITIILFTLVSGVTVNAMTLINPEPTNSDTGVLSSTVTVPAPEEHPVWDIIKNKDIKGTDQFLVTITRPDGNECTLADSYIICGITEFKDISYSIAVYDSVKRIYMPLTDDDGKSIWDVGAFGLFTKEITLKKGVNKIKIVAFKKTQANVLELGENLQVNYFSVTYLDDDVDDFMMNSYFRYQDLFNNIFN